MNHVHIFGEVTVRTATTPFRVVKVWFRELSGLATNGRAESPRAHESCRECRYVRAPASASVASVAGSPLALLGIRASVERTR